MFDKVKTFMDDIIKKRPMYFTNGVNNITLELIPNGNRPVIRFTNNTTGDEVEVFPHYTYLWGTPETEINFDFNPRKGFNANLIKWVECEGDNEDEMLSDLNDQEITNTQLSLNVDSENDNA